MFTAAIKLLGEFYFRSLQRRLSRDLALWFTPTRRTTHKRSPASDLLLPPVDHYNSGPQTTEGKILRCLSKNKTEVVCRMSAIEKRR